MGGLGSSRVEPSAWRAWLVRAGLAKAEERELPWLIAELDRAETDRGIRRGWILAVQALPCLVLACLRVVVDGTRFNVLWYAGGYAVGVIAIGVVAPGWGFRRRHTSVLRLHGRNTDGRLDQNPTRFSRVDPTTYALMQATIVVGTLGVLALSARALSHPGTLEVTECHRTGSFVVATVEMHGRGLLAPTPRITWADPATGAPLASTRLFDVDVQTVHREVEDQAGSSASAVVCRIDD